MTNPDEPRDMAEAYEQMWEAQAERDRAAEAATDDTDCM